MMTEVSPSDHHAAPQRRDAAGVAERAVLHRALGDERRLWIVDALQLSDRSPGELATLTGLSTNLLAFHLDVLESAHVITRTASQGDGRRRYVSLRRERLAALAAPPPLEGRADVVLFVCTANSARSQLAAHLWRRRTGRPAWSAGTAPADRVHPLAVEVARRNGLDLADARPRGYGDIEVDPDVVVSVCDRAHEDRTATLGAPVLHWSVPDPAGGDKAAFARAFDDITDRVERLARAVTAPAPP